MGNSLNSNRKSSLDDLKPFNRSSCGPVSKEIAIIKQAHSIQTINPINTKHKVELPKSYDIWNSAYLNHKIHHPEHIEQFNSRITQNSIRRDYLRKADEVRTSRSKAENELFSPMETINQIKSIYSCYSLESRCESSRLAFNKYYPTPEKKLPELTPDKTIIINEALVPYPEKQALVEIDGVPILRKDIKTLDGLNWLNDEIVNAYLHLIVQRSLVNGKKAYAFNTFFYPKLRDSGYNSVKRWTRKADIFSHSFVLVPVHLGNHWCLAVIDFIQRTISYYDSLGGRSDKCCDILLDYLRNESLDKRKQDFDDENWRLIDAYNENDGIPQQGNFADCGVFLCTYAEYLTRQSKLNFSQQHMPYFRRKIIYEIMTKRLMDI